MGLIIGNPHNNGLKSLDYKHLKLQSGQRLLKLFYKLKSSSLGFKNEHSASEQTKRLSCSA